MTRKREWFWGVALCAVLSAHRVTAEWCQNASWCDDGVVCTSDYCLPNHQCYHEAANAACDDGLFCNGIETCDIIAGCKSGTSPCGGWFPYCDEVRDLCSQCRNDLDCNDNNACTTNTCDVTTGICVFPGKNCSDGNACTLDQCNPSTGACTNTTITCNDGNPCTLDSCAPSTGCIFTPITCNDSNACTTDSCSPATGCQHVNISCDDQNACTFDACNSATGCQHSSINCNDQNACTTDGCNPTTGCTHVAVVCNDNNPCTADNCSASTGCKFTPYDCTDGNACTDDSCNSLTGACVNSPITCTDSDACTVDSCDLTTGCHFSPISCDDNNPCTHDFCNPSTGCAHSAVDCDDGMLCTVDACEPARGCVHSPRECPDDGILCNGVPLCNEIDGCHTKTDPCASQYRCDESLHACVPLTTYLTAMSAVSESACHTANPVCPDARTCLEATVEECVESFRECFTEFIGAELPAAVLSCLIGHLGVDEWEALVERYGDQAAHYVPWIHWIICGYEIGEPIANFAGCVTGARQILNQRVVECNCRDCDDAPDCEDRFGIKVRFDGLCPYEGVYADVTCLDHGQDTLSDMLFTGIAPESTFEKRCGPNANWQVASREVFDMNTGRGTGRFCSPTTRHGTHPARAGNTVSAGFNCMGSTPCQPRGSIALVFDVAGLQDEDHIGVQVSYTAPGGLGGGSLSDVAGAHVDYASGLYAFPESAYTLEVASTPPGVSCAVKLTNSAALIPAQWTKSRYNVGVVNCDHGGSSTYAVHFARVNHTQSDPGLLRLQFRAPDAPSPPPDGWSVPCNISPLKDRTPYHAFLQGGQFETGWTTARYNTNMECRFDGGGGSVSGLISGASVAHTVRCQCKDLTDRCDRKPTDPTPGMFAPRHGQLGELNPRIFEVLTGGCRGSWDWDCGMIDTPGAGEAVEIPCSPGSGQCPCCEGTTPGCNTPCAGCQCNAASVTVAGHCRLVCVTPGPKSAAQTSEPSLAISVAPARGPEPSIIVDSEMWLTARASDPDGILAYAVAVDWGFFAGDFVASDSVDWGLLPIRVDTSLLTNGRHLLHVAVVDANDDDPLQTIAQLEFVVDHTPAPQGACASDLSAPIVSIDAPRPGQLLSAGPVQLRANATDDTGVQRVQFLIDDPPYVRAGGSGSEYTYTWSAQPGVHTLAARAYDVCGKMVTTPPLRVTVGNATPCGTDSTGPTVAITHPTPGASLPASAVTIDAAAQGPNGVERVEFHVGSYTPVTDSTAPFSITFPFFEAGVYSLSATAFDVCGNSSTSSAVEVTIQNGVALCAVDHLPPTVVITSPSDGAFVPRVPLTVRVDAADPSGIEGVAFEIDGTPLEDAVDLAAPFEYTFLPTRAMHSLSAKARDHCANQASARSIVIAVSNAKPTAAADEVSVQRGGSVLFAPLANDSDADGDSIALAFDAIIEAPAHGTVVRVSDTALRYTPNAGFPTTGTGSDVFRYRIVDTFGTVNSARVFVTVSP